MLEQLKDVICRYIDVERNMITEEARFVEDLGFTSFDFMSMLGELEETYDVEVEEREASDIVTVGEAVRYLEKLKNKA